MKFHNLIIQNFLTVKHAALNLEDKGLHLIQGVNEDDSSATSNGAGKSSIVDAISWVLFGLTAREVKGDAVVNLAAKKECCVTLFLSSGTSMYRIARYRKHSTGKNALQVWAQIPGGEADLSRGTDAETQKFLEGILGCSYEVFVAAVYSGQEAMPDLPKMKDRELKTLIEEAAGMQRIERAYEIARQRNLEAKHTAEIAESKKSSLLTNKVAAEERLDLNRAKLAAWDADRAPRVKAAIMTRDEAVEAEKRAVDKYTSMKGHAENAQASIEKIEVELTKHKTLMAAVAAADAAVRKAELAIDTVTLKRLVEEVKKQEARIANAESEIKKPCTECGTVLETMSVDDFKAHVSGHIKKLSDEILERKEVATRQLEALKVARQAAADARAAVPNVSELTEERARLQPVVQAYKDAGEAYRRVGMAAEAASTQVALISREVNPYIAIVDADEKAVAEIVGRMGAAQTECDEAQRAAKVSAAVVKLFGPAGVRAQILDTVTPFLNDRTADYLSALSDGEISAVWTTLTKSASGELKEKFSLDVTHAKGGDSFAALSGGEKRKVRLATALALQDLVASRATQPIDLWVGDELDDALDPAGLERLMTILERKARERGTVLVISHSDLRDWIDNVTTVRKTALWSSTVEGSLVCA